MDAFTTVVGRRRGTGDISLRDAWWCSPDIDTNIRSWIRRMRRRGATNFVVRLEHDWELLAAAEDEEGWPVQWSRPLSEEEASHLISIWLGGD